jgi:putative ABC transport system ATP-binding protein
MVVPRVVSLRNLRFAWSDVGVPLLDVPEFFIGKAERVFLYGPSGSGKTTLLSLICGVLTPNAGSVSLLDRDLSAMDGPERDRQRGDHVGYIFQQFNLMPYLSVVENVVLAIRFSLARRRRIADAGREPRAEAVRLLGHLELPAGAFDRTVTDLSVGQQQRVAIARALIGGPELVIADEPTSALDEERRAAFLDLLLRECADAGASVLFVSHDRRLAARFDRTLALADINAAAGAEAAQ